MHDDMMIFKPPTYMSEQVWEHSYGPQVTALCQQIGYIPDPEQERILDALFAVDPVHPEQAASYETGVIGPRQNLKTGVGKMAALGWMFVTQEEVVTWSAHLFPTAAETFRDLAAIIENSPMLLKRLANGRKGIHGARGSESIELKGYRELRFRARTKTGTRGLTGDKIVMDEAFALREDHMGSVLPTLTAVPDPQILYLSSAGMIDSDVLRDLRDRGRTGAPRLSYYEWCSSRKPCEIEFEGRWVQNPNCTHPKPGTAHWKPGCALDDESLWAEANPLLGRKRANGTGLTLEKMRTFRRSEPPGEWQRERMGWWDDPGTLDVFGPGNWSACERVFGDDMPPLLTIGIAVSIDMTRASLVGATGTRRDPMVRVLQNGPGTDWVIPRLEEVKRDHPHVQFALDPVGPAGNLLRDIKLRDNQHNVDPINPVELSLNDALDACGDMQQAVAERRLAHEGDPELDQAVRDAAKRELRDRWLWARKQSGSDISPLEAATFAVWALSEEPYESAYETGLVATV